MTKGNTQWALMFLISEGYTTKKLMEMGYSLRTIYYYRHRYKTVIKPEIETKKGIK